MVEREIPAGRRPPTGAESGGLPVLSRPPITSPGDVLPFAPNLLATIASFGFMVVVPWVGLWVTDWIMDRYDVFDELDPAYLAFIQGISLFVAFEAALLFLVIGMIFQFCLHHKPFPSWWPCAMAFPVAWGLLLPEALVRGDSVRYLLMVGATIALAFCVHWLSLMTAREAME
jgi:hypothetical protein